MIKWAINRQYWGKGFAGEAAKAVQKAATISMPDTKLISFMNSENEASIRVAQSIGATFEKETVFRDSIWHIYRHPQRI